jgi:hypothetical protein
MRTYQFESVVPDNGRISLPMTMKSLAHHRVKFIVIDLEEILNDPCERLDALTRAYTALDEPDIDLDEVYRQRAHIDDRQYLFD